MTDFLPYFDFHYIVKKHRGYKGIRDFSSWNQLLMMLFGQLSNCDSISRSISLSTLSRSNANRNYRIFEVFAFLMMVKAQKYRAGIDFDIPVNGHVYAFDSSKVSLCLNVFWWATYKRQKDAIKLHMLYDVMTQIPDFFVVTPASDNDVNGMDYIEYQIGSYYVFDRGYNDFARLYNIHIREVFFVFRAREKVKFRRIYSMRA